MSTGTQSSSILTFIPTFSIPSSFTNFKSNQTTTNFNRLCASKRVRSLHSSASIHMNILPNLYSLYSTSLATFPLITKSCTSGSIIFLSSLISQQLTISSTHSTSKLNFKQALNQSLLGFLLFGPIGHFWFNFLEHIPFNSHTSTFFRTISKITLDQLLLSPILNAILFFHSGYFQNNASHQHRITSGLNSVESNLKSSLIASYKLWPFVHLLTFTIIPLDFRVLYINAVSLGWFIFLSLMNSNHGQLYNKYETEFRNNQLFTESFEFNEQQNSNFIQKV
mmetsp:Transcript_6443/g.11469  ORF Transcript_6443/g.11469 Transcript_6443/m.11469 type:complete len:280 (-) Transcript_6443:164-1003(-)